MREKRKRARPQQSWWSSYSFDLWRDRLPMWKKNLLSNVHTANAYVQPRGNTVSTSPCHSSKLLGIDDNWNNQYPRRKKKRKIKKMKEVTTHSPGWGGIKMGLHIINNILLFPSSSPSWSSSWSGKHSLQNKRHNCSSTRDKYATLFKLVQADYKFLPDPEKCIGNRGSTIRHLLQLCDGNQDQRKPKTIKIIKNKKFCYLYLVAIQTVFVASSALCVSLTLSHTYLHRHLLRMFPTGSLSPKLQLPNTARGLQVLNWLRTPRSGVNSSMNFEDQFTKSGSIIQSQLTETNQTKHYSIRQTLPASSICPHPSPDCKFDSISPWCPSILPDLYKPMLLHVQRLVVSSPSRGQSERDPRDI